MKKPILSIGLKFFIGVLSIAAQKGIGKLGASLFLSLLLSSIASFGQNDLKSLLKTAEKNYPSIAAKQAEAEAAKSELQLEKNTLLPSLDAAYQVNYSTYNNITGMNYPATLIPISGPPSSENVYDAVPGSAASLMFKWSPITFGQRSAAVELHRKLYEQQLAGVEDEILKIQFGVAFMYLEIAATQELIKAYQKNIERNEFNLRQVYSLVTAGIRPGVDSLKFKGELSKTRTELYGLQNLLESQKQELLELLVTEEISDFEVNDFLFRNLPVLPEPGSSDTTVNPILEMARYSTEANEDKLSQIKRSWTPRFEIWSTLYGRGSGINFDGTVNKSDGWSFSRYNYGVGVQLVFPILGLRDVHLRSNQQGALLRSSQKYFDQTKIYLQKQENVFVGDMTTSLQIANEVPVEYEANVAAYHALQTRYQTGLIDYTELIQAQYDLLNAESRLKNSYISSWKSLLKLAVIRGDMNIFLNQIQN